MAIAFRSSSSVNSAGSGSVELPKPAGLADGDVVVAVLTQDSTTDEPWSSSDGFSILGNLYTTAGKDMTTAFAWKAIGSAGSEPSTWTFSTSNAGQAKAVAAAAFSGVDTSDPLDVVSGISTGENDATPPAATLTTTVDGAMVITACHLAYPLDRSIVGGAPSGWALAGHTSNSDADSFAFSALAYKLQASAGAVSGGNWTNSPDDALCEYHVRALSLNPASENQNPKVWNGSAWVGSPYVRGASSWDPAVGKIWSGSAWV